MALEGVVPRDLRDSRTFRDAHGRFMGGHGGFKPKGAVSLKRLLIDDVLAAVEPLGRVRAFRRLIRLVIERADAGDAAALAAIRRLLPSGHWAA